MTTVQSVGGTWQHLRRLALGGLLGYGNLIRRDGARLRVTNPRDIRPQLFAGNQTVCRLLDSRAPVLRDYT